LQTRGEGISSDANVRTVFLQFTRFFENYDVFTRTRGGFQVVWTRGRCVNFLRFCVDVFYGRLIRSKSCWTRILQMQIISHL